MTTTERALIAEAKRNDEAMTGGPWEIWTSNSFRRITARGQQDGGVLSGVIQRHDGHPDLGGRNRDRDLAGIAWLRTNLRALIDGYSRALDEVERLREGRDLARADLAVDVAVLKHPASSRNDLTEVGLRLVDDLVHVRTELAELKLVFEQQDRDLERMRAGLQEALTHWRYPQESHAEKARKDEIWSIAYGDNATIEGKT